MKIAIVKLSALGDIVHAMVALQYIKQAFDGIEIDWVVENQFAGVLEHNPDIDNILTVNLKGLKQDKSLFFSELKKLRQFAAHHYDLVIDAQGLIKSAIVARLLSKNTAGFDRDSIREKPASFLYNKKVTYPYDANTIDRNTAVIAHSLAIKISEQQVFNKAPFLFYKQSDPKFNQFFTTEKANIIFVIGSTWASRNYPKQQYLNVIKELNTNSLIIWGNEEEKQDAEWIVEQTDQARILPKMDFNELKAVLTKADLVIGNDTGPTHMAWGLNKPSITLFGPTPISRVYQTPINKVLKSPSLINPFKLDKNDFSINQIKENEIIELSQTILSGCD